MALTNSEFAGKRRSARGHKWSGRRTIGAAIITSGFLWIMIFWIAKALVA